MSVSRPVVCLPTYNERENLEPMVRALADKDVNVLVIDDNSPDGTGEIADRLASELSWVDVLHRPCKEGLGRAYAGGFRHVLASGAELVLEMDCDFSHDPADVPRLIAAVEARADLALGSRYREGGGIRGWGGGRAATPAGRAPRALGSRYVEGGSIGDWGRSRRAISAGGSLYARMILGVAVRDMTAGF